jgi:hypothetical protein
MSHRGPVVMAHAASIANKAMNDLGLGEHLSLSSIAKVVEQRRGRPLRVVELVALANDEVCGVWLVTEREDIVLHAPTDSVLYAQQFVLHELAHMILRHDVLAAAASGADVLLPDLPVAIIRRVLTRSRFDDETEVAAEVLADLLAGSIRRSGVARSSYSRVFA